jgi:hypothetical protein
MSRILPTLLLLPLLVVGCADDPMERPGTFQPRGVNDANLRAMIVDPTHLQRGQEALTSRGDAAARPVTQLRAGKRPSLTEKGNNTGIQLNMGGGQDGAR